jgi:hypothetical protein
MNLPDLIPITLFICIAYSIKVVADTYMRRRIIQAHGTDALVRLLLESDITRRHQLSLHWGCVLSTLAAGFGLVELSGVDRVTPGTIALLLGATGLGNLGYYLLQSQLNKHQH